MPWGDFFTNAYNGAKQAAQSAATALGNGAQAVGSAAKAAGNYVANKAVSAGNYAVQQATAAKDYAVEKGTQAASYVADKAQQGYAAAKSGAQAVGTGVSNVGGFAGRATSESVSAAYKGVNKAFSGSQTPQQVAITPCPNTVEGKKARLEERQRLITAGKGSSDPAVQNAANRLQENNQSVEMARLSQDAYAQYADPPVNKPPLGWTAMSDHELEEKGLSPQLLKDSQAVVYQNPPDWPGGQKTVLAFRGTADAADGIVDYNQAFAIETTQYKAATRLGADVSDALGPDTLVTGHSLGGGKAAAAGMEGGLKGMMFNAAGVNPDTVPGKTAAPGQFQQYRSTSDPLTGTQNSAAIQTGVLGVVGLIGTPLSALAAGANAVGGAVGHPLLTGENAQFPGMGLKAIPRALKNIITLGNAMPPAQGTIHVVEPYTDAGKTVGTLNVMGQHSIGNLINGIEVQKSSDVATLGGTN